MKLTPIGLIRSVLFGLLLALGSLQVHAQDPITFNFRFSGDGATAVGSVTFASRTAVIDPSAFNFSVGAGQIQALTMTVTGASSGNGTFTSANYASATFEGASSLDLGSANLVSGAWGPSGVGGDFNLFADFSGSGAPTGWFQFTLATQGGEMMQLTNLSAVPEPSTYAAGMGLLALGFATYRRRRPATTH